MNLPAKLGARWLGMVIFAIAAASGARAQVRNSGAATITLQAVLSDSISVSLSSNAVNFNLTAGNASNPGSTSVTATTTWALKPSVGSLKLYAFFSSSTAALTDGAGNNIASADFQISDNAGPFNALTNTVPFGGANAGLQLSSTPILGNNRTGSRNDVMNFNINLVPLPNLPAATYTGTLTIQAQAI
jgi:hypothetical protein